MKQQQYLNHWKHAILFSGIAVLSLLTLVGCEKKKPSDMPALYPCKLTITQEGKPLEGATVSLIAQGKSLRFTTAAITDKQGVAVIKTDIDWTGVPEGKYKVCVKKVSAPDSGVSDEIPSDPVAFAEYQKKLAEASAQTMSYVDSKYLRPRTTPLEIEVTTSGFEDTVDVGPAVSQKWDDVTKSSS